MDLMGVEDDDLAASEGLLENFGHEFKVRPVLMYLYPQTGMEYMENWVSLWPWFCKTVTMK